MKTLDGIKQRVARAIYGVRRLTMCWEVWEAEAQAAIDALPIIILPHDAKPEVFDLVTGRPNDKNAMPFVFHGDVTQHTKLYIVRRNGVAVIMEGEDDER